MTILGQLTYREISEQPEALTAAMKQLELQRDWVRQYIGNPAFDEVIFIGSGSSYYQAVVMASAYRKWMGKNAAAYPSSEIFLFREHSVPAGRKVLLVGVSRSGESSELILALESVKRLPNWTISGITCYGNSKLASIADCLISPSGQEQSMVMTKSFSSMTYMMLAAIAAASGKEQIAAELNAALAMDARIVRRADPFIQALIKENDFNKYIYLGMGTYFGLAQEACLKIKEMAYVWTESYGTLEFRHGPKSIVEPGTLVCLLVSEHARSYELKVAEEMKRLGAFILLLTATQGTDTEFADAVFEIGGKHLTDDARSVLYMPAVQYLGYYVALKKGIDPDCPRNLTQVVKL